MSERPIKPAWGALYRWVLSDPRPLPREVSEGVERLYALAAFTREDVANLNAMPDGTGYASIDDPAWFASLIDRIAALLPPEP